MSVRMKLTEKQKDRLSTAYQMYSSEYEGGEPQTPMPQAGGVSELITYYNYAISEGIADKISSNKMRTEQELLKKIGKPPQ